MVQEKETCQKEYFQGRFGKPGCPNSSSKRAVVSSTSVTELAGGVGNLMLGNGELGGRPAAFKFSQACMVGQGKQEGRADVSVWVSG